MQSICGPPHIIAYSIVLVCNTSYFHISPKVGEDGSNGVQVLIFLKWFNQSSGIDLLAHFSFKYVLMFMEGIGSMELSCQIWTPHMVLVPKMCLTQIHLQPAILYSSRSQTHLI